VKSKQLRAFLATEAEHLRQAGLLRQESTVGTPAGPTVTVAGRELLNLASSDFLGLASNAEVRKAAKVALDEWGTGLCTPRLVNGTLRMHQDLERAVAAFHGTEDAVVFASGYHAATGLLESLFGDRDFVFCDEQLDPAMADGVRLCRARVYSYRSQDLEHLEDRLKRSRAVSGHRD
jgi:glycine C-acetyltransferase